MSHSKAYDSYSFMFTEFENMSTSTGAAKGPAAEPAVGKSQAALDADKEDLYTLIAKMSTRVSEMDETLKALKVIVDAM